MESVYSCSFANCTELFVIFNTYWRIKRTQFMISQILLEMILINYEKLITSKGTLLSEQIDKELGWNSSDLFQVTAPQLPGWLRGEAGSCQPVSLICQIRSKASRNNCLGTGNKADHSLLRYALHKLLSASMQDVLMLIKWIFRCIQEKEGNKMKSKHYPESWNLPKAGSTWNPRLSLTNAWI
jgi:hypothetical protein